MKVILIGNKSDLEYKREVSYEEASNFASSNNYYYIETSCLENKNVLQAFEKIIIETYKETEKEKEKEKKNGENLIKIGFKKFEDKRKVNCF